MRPIAVWCALFVVLVSPSRASAQTTGKPIAVQVLSVESDDAEDQADALSGALRSRVRGAPGWSLSDTSHSLGLLTAALRCPARPDPPCLQRIADQLHADHFFWGLLSKSVGHQIVAEVHYWSRGKPDAMLKETYSDNLRDQNDEVLRKIASHIFEKLTGTESTGTVTVRSNVEDAAIFVDGSRRGQLDRGQASIELSPGQYTIDLRARGYQSARAITTVQAGTDATASITLNRENANPSDASEPASKPLPLQKIVGIGTLAAGIGFGIAGVVEGVRFVGLQSDNEQDSKNVRASDFCSVRGADAERACDTYKSAKTARMLELVFLGVGAALATTGAVLLLTDHSGDKKEPAKTSLRFSPYVGTASGGVDMHLKF